MGNLKEKTTGENSIKMQNQKINDMQIKFKEFETTLTNFQKINEAKLKEESNNIQRSLDLKIEKNKNNLKEMLKINSQISENSEMKDIFDDSVNILFKIFSLSFFLFI